jgi:hypothetical protein
MTVAFLGMIDMVVNEQWAYIILPIGILIWGIFKFFDENDREYLEHMGIDPDEFNAFFPDYYSNYSYRRTHRNNNSYNTYDSVTNVNKNTITWDSPSDSRRKESTVDAYSGFGSSGFFIPQKRNNPQYKGMVEKCKRNFKITIEEKKSENESKRERIHHSINSFFN